MLQREGARCFAPVFVRAEAQTFQDNWVTRQSFEEKGELETAALVTVERGSGTQSE